MEANGLISRLKSSTAGSGSKRILIIAGVIIVAAVAWSAFSTPDLPVNPSSVAAPPPGYETRQGSQPVTHAYDEALRTADSQRIEEARSSGGSALPTVRASTQEQVLPVIDPDPVEEAPPVVDLPVVQPPIVVQQPVTPASPVVQPPAAPRNPQVSQRMVDAVAILRRTPPVAEVTRFSNGEIAAPRQEQSPPAVDAPPSAAQPDADLPPPGTILYAEMVSRANSDTPGPVLARILQGRYAGATLIGSFSTAQNALIIQFSRMTYEEDGATRTVAVNATAVDTAHVGTALATSVDRHLFQKLSIGFVASFAEGFGNALARSGTTR